MNKFEFTDEELECLQIAVDIWFNYCDTEEAEVTANVVMRKLTKLKSFLERDENEQV